MIFLLFMSREKGAGGREREWSIGQHNCLAVACDLSLFCAERKGSRREENGEVNWMTTPKNNHLAVAHD